LLRTLYRRLTAIPAPVTRW